MRSGYEIRSSTDRQYGLCNLTNLLCSLFRNVGMGTSTSAARLGSFASPYVVHLVREITDTLFIFVFFFFLNFAQFVTIETR